LAKFANIRTAPIAQKDIATRGIVIHPRVMVGIAIKLALTTLLVLSIAPKRIPRRQHARVRVATNATQTNLSALVVFANNVTPQSRSVLLVIVTKLVQLTQYAQ
jgi:hypothetical protein